MYDHDIEELRDSWMNGNRKTVCRTILEDENPILSAAQMSKEIGAYFGNPEAEIYLRILETCIEEHKKICKK